MAQLLTGPPPNFIAPVCRVAPGAYAWNLRACGGPGHDRAAAL